MELIKGQNISLGDAQHLVIDLGWRSLVTDLNMQAYGLYQAVAEPSDKAKDKLIYLEHDDFNPHIIRAKDGRRFTLALNQLSAMQKLAIALVLPTASRYNFSQVQHLQAFIYTAEGEKIATIKLPEHDEAAQGMSFLEIYQHQGQWKLKLSAQSWLQNLEEMSESLNLEMPESLKLKTLKQPSSETITPSSQLTDAEAPVQNASKEVLRDGVKLTMGGAFSLTEDFPYLQHLVWKVRTTPQLDDIKLNVVALTKHDKVRSFEDFIYSNNAELEHGGVRLQLKNERTLVAHIEFDKIPAEITKLCLIATRESTTKRLSSADFIKTKLESANTRIPVCHFSCATVDKNYNCIILLEVYRHDKQWKVKAVGQGYAQGLQAIGETYGFSAPRSALRSNTSKNEASKFNPNSSTPTQPTLQTPNQSIPNSTGIIGICLFVFALLSTISAIASFSVLPLIISIIFAAIGGYLVMDARKKAQQQLVEENERFMLNIIKLHNYQITPFQIAANYTLSTEQATLLLDNLCQKGAGHLTNLEDGSQVYVFEELKSSGSDDKEQW
jgi:tellurium resistance protein TerD